MFICAGENTVQMSSFPSVHARLSPAHIRFESRIPVAKMLELGIEAGYFAKGFLKLVAVDSFPFFNQLGFL